MFPKSLTEDTDKVKVNSSIISDNSKIRKTINFNFEKKSTELINGDVDLIDDYKNIRNWIVKFLNTPVNVYEIYEGTGFGTSLYLLKGHKSIGGMEYAQIKKEVENGFKLNPCIRNVIDFRLYKREKTLCVYVKCQLIDGYILEESTEVFELK